MGIAGDALRDLRFALRGLRRSPRFAFLAILTLALGIGATAAIASVVHTILLKPPPYRDADRIVRMMMNVPASESRTGVPQRAPVTISAAEVAQLQARSRTLTHAGTMGGTLTGLGGGYEDGARLQGSRVSASLLHLVAARPLLGRLLAAGDEAAGAPPVILLSHLLWTRHFSSDPAIVGRSIKLQSVLGPRRETDHTVVGVMPAHFTFPDSRTTFWMPFQASAAAGPVMRGPLVARLADGVSREAAVTEMAPIVRELRQHKGAITYELVAEHEEAAAPMKPALLVLTAGVGFVLLIACVNVANLLLVRASRRQRESAVRAAIGAGRGRLVRQALVESLTLAAAGASAGIGVAAGAIYLLRRLATTMARVDLGTSPLLPRLEEIGLDAMTLAVTAAIAMAAGVLVGLAPATRHARADLVDVLKRGDAPRARRRFSTRDLLVMVQMALATALLIGGGLLARSFVELTSVDRGYDASNVLTFQIALPVAPYPTDRLRAFVEELTSRLQSVPGIQAAAYANQLPMVKLRDTFGGLWRTPDATRMPVPNAPDARFVSRDYFKVMGIRLLAGRVFDERDRGGAPRAALINETLARREFPSETPVGQLRYLGRDLEPLHIVGVVQDVRQFALDREPESQIFMDLRQWPGTGPLFPVGPYFAVRADNAAVLAGIRQIVRGMEPQAALFNVTSMTEIVDATVARPRLNAVLLGIFASIGAVLALVGVYGVVSYAVEQRTRELGIRIAIGARRRDVIGTVLGHSVLLTGIGLASGIAAALMLTRFLEGLLFGVKPFDPVILTGVAVAFAAVATLAALIPARRAARVDPAITLRAE